MAEFLQFIATGLSVGAIYALIALGFVIIFNASEVVNFAQGEFVMIGAMLTVFLHEAGWPLFPAVVLALALSPSVGVALYWGIISRARNASPATLIMITIGASVFLRGMVQVLYDKSYHTLPSFSSPEIVMIGQLAISTQMFWILAGLAIVLAAVAFFFTRTTTGKAMRATANNSMAATVVGINTKLIVGIAFGMSAAIAALGGILITPITLASSDMGALLAVKAFAAATLGGLGSPVGAVVGGLLLGILEALGAGYVSTAYKDAVAFVVLFLVLSFFPNGLLRAIRNTRV